MSEENHPPAEYAVGDHVIIVHDDQMDGEFEGETGVVKDVFYAEPQVAGFGPPGWKYAILMDFDADDWADADPEEDEDMPLTSYTGASLESA